MSLSFLLNFVSVFRKFLNKNQLCSNLKRMLYAVWVLPWTAFRGFPGIRNDGLRSSWACYCSGHSLRRATEKYFDISESIIIIQERVFQSLDLSQRQDFKRYDLLKVLPFVTIRERIIFTIKSSLKVIWRWEIFQPSDSFLLRILYSL